MKILFVGLWILLSAGVCFSQTGSPPVIGQQPISQTVSFGSLVRFDVNAAGTYPLSFQWRRNGTAIAGATASSGYLISFATTFDAGAYSVVLSNAFGSITSSNAVLTVLSPPAANTNCTPVPGGLVSFWRAEGSANDSTGEANGTLYGGVSFAFGKVATCFSFDGTNGGINVPDVPALALTNSLTIEGWIYVTNAPSTVGMILFRGDARPDIYPYFLDVEPQGTTGRIRFGVENGNYGISYIDSQLITGAWLHVAATLDGDTGAQRLYTNGVLAVETATSIRPLGPLNPAYEAGVGIGNHSGQPGPFNYPFKGLIDELSVYNRTLSASEIQGIYKSPVNGKCPAGAPPTIVRQPQSQTVNAGSTVSFVSYASGSPPMYYQWLKEGVPIAGARFTGYSFSAQPTNAENYRVAAINPYGTTLSSNVVVTVISGLKVGSVNAGSGFSVTVPVWLTADGHENALSFSLNFSNSLLTYASTILANGAGATLFVNESQTSKGQVGVVLALPAGTSFPAGSQELVEITFITALLTNGFVQTPISFADQPIVRQVSDPFGNVLPANYSSGWMIISPVPSLRIAQSNQWIRLAWPLSAGNYNLREGVPTSEWVSWSAVSNAPRVIGSENVVLLPINGTSKFYRLQK